jgi:hypothetical protein
MPASIRTKHTITPNSPPANLSLQPGELAVELAVPNRLWVGVPTTLDATGRKLLINASATVADVWVNTTGDTMTGPLIGTTATYSGKVTAQWVLATGGRVTADGTGAAASPVPPTNGDASVIVNKRATANNCGVWGFLNGSTRWGISLADQEPEGGANSGSNFSITRYDDAGAVISTPVIGITRSNGAIRYEADSCDFMLNTPLAAYRMFAFNTNGAPRWAMYVTDAGENFGWNAMDDAGTFLSSPLSINRLTGTATFAVPIVNGSDRSLKENIAPITRALDKVKALQGVSFNRIGAEDREIGFIAQDVLNVVPEVVRETEIAVPDNAPAEIKALLSGPKLGVTYAQLTALLVEAVKELSAKVATLEAQIAQPRAANGRKT